MTERFVQVHPPFFICFRKQFGEFILRKLLACMISLSVFIVLTKTQSIDSISFKVLASLYPSFFASSVNQKCWSSVETDDGFYEEFEFNESIE